MVFAALLGLLWGSFANVAIARVPAGESVVRPASRCGSCGTPIRWYDNVPIVSWLALRGRCRACGARFSARYLVVELATGALFALAWWTCFVDAAGDPLGVRAQRFVSYAAFALCMVVLTFIDLELKKIPDRITYPAIPLFLGLGLMLRDRPWYDCAIGAVAGYGVVRAISDGYYWITKREGLGYGDGKLLAIVGGLLGWRAALFALFGGAVLGSVIGVAILAARRRGRDEEGSIRHVELPFGPFLAAAALIYMYAERPIETFFASTFGVTG
jgi:leader peptidase (prepilin peptidase)/N-methyltransferase